MRPSISFRRVALWLVLPAIGVTASAAAQAPARAHCGAVDLAGGVDDASGPAGGAVQEIYALLDAWREALAAGDGPAVTALVTDSAEFWSQGTSPIKGRAALAEAFAPFFSDYQLLQVFDCSELIVRGNVAFLRGLERNRLISRASGDTTIVIQRAFSIVRRSPDGQWRFARGMTNQPPSP